ncbi:hypothetical protein [Sulfurospirillum barnesii]|uniref:Uncharacterized protein n=1 Tax=Sulfurospirillum barnesii (strain ATCC 700032 / DSM 10660 / SES-3) TaxID=760154 RepID=I3Y0P3_SULBS|nr:hypothetical protein [Sulfurospirillum barnesii]AFL69767.1 hypothetical protein Sulba_2500 [Sulfurospirillum barnesii SES-3]
MKTTMKEINGKQVPVTTIENGEAVNNVEIKDMNPLAGNFTMEDFNRMMALHNQRVNANEVTLSAEITAKEIIKGKERIDKDSRLPVLDSDGFPTFYPNRYKITFTFKGGTLTQTVSEEMYTSLEMGATYMLKGALGFVKDFGQEVLSPIWKSWEKVA